MAEQLKPKSAGAFGYLSDLIEDYFYPSKPAPPADTGGKKKTVDTGKPKAQTKQTPYKAVDPDAGITVERVETPPDKELLDPNAIAEGIAAGLGSRRGPPMSAEEAMAIAKLLGYTGVIPSPPDVSPMPMPEGYNIPLDLRPTANWLDQMFGTKYLAGTPSSEDYMNAAMKARSISTGGPAIEQARAQARLAEYEALLKQQDLPNLIKAIHGGRGLTYGGVLPESAPASTLPPAPGVADVPAQPLAQAPSPADNLTAAQKLRIAEKNAETRFQNANAKFKQRIEIKGLAPKYAEMALKDELIKKFNNAIQPDVMAVREILDPRKKNISGQEALAAIQKFQRGLIDPNAVHLGEIQNIAALQGSMDKLTNMVQGMISGNYVLGPNTRQEILDVTSDIFNSYRSAAQRNLQNYVRMGAAEGVKPKDIKKIVPNIEPQKVRFRVKQKNGKWQSYDVPFGLRKQTIEKLKKQKLEYTEEGH